MNRRLGIALAAVPLVLMQIVAAVPPAEGAATVKAHLNSGRLIELSQVIQRVARRHYGNQFGQISYDGVNDRLRLRWRGPLPAEIQRMVSAAGTQLELTTARFSESQFLAEEQRILDAYGNVVTQVAPTDAFDGLEVMVRPSESLTAAKATITSSMPVVFVTGRVQVPLNGRQGDTAPFYGGASTVGPGGECSSGFAVKKGTIKYMVTADHCGHTGISFPNFHTPPGIIVGHTYYYRYSLDSQAITGTDYASTMYSGCWTCTSTKAVSGAGNPVVGTVVCASGAYSGLVCDNLVSKYPVGGIIDGHAFSGFWQIRNQDGNGAGGFGDSGGPIYLPRSDGTAFVVGIVSSSPGESTDYGACQGLTTGRDCFQTVDIPGAGDILAWLGATVP